MKYTAKIKYMIGCLLCLLATSFISCNDDSNDWPVNPDDSQMFRSLIFRSVVVNPTDIQIEFSKMPRASSYVFEFSTDSLEFNNIFSTVELLADTLTAYSTGNPATRTLFRPIFGDMPRDTTVSVRMRVMSADGTPPSEYVMFAFVTPEENLFLPEMYTELTQAILYWTPTNELDKLELINNVTGEQVGDGSLTPDEIALGSKTFTGLDQGTSYTATLYYGDIKRGLKGFSTKGTAGSFVYEVQDADDLSTVLASLYGGGQSAVTLTFAYGKTYNAASITVPAGMTSLTFTGLSSQYSTILNTDNLAVSAPLTTVKFENINLIGSDNASKRFIDTNQPISNIVFEGCKIQDYNCVVRLQNAAMTVEKIKVNNCYIYNTGGYGVFNTAASATLTLDSLILTNSTLHEIGTQLMDVRCVTKEINVSYCTFFNNTSKLSQLMRFDTNYLPLTVSVNKSIFSGPNGGTLAKSTAGNYSGLLITFGSSYKTSDFKEGAPAFTDIMNYSGTAYNLFVDPDNGDFHIKPGAGFAGTGSVGDPRYWQ